MNFKDLNAGCHYGPFPSLFPQYTAPDLYSNFIVPQVTSAGLGHLRSKGLFLTPVSMATQCCLVDGRFWHWWEML